MASKVFFAYQTGNGSRRPSPVKLFGDFVDAHKILRVYLGDPRLLSAEEAIWTLEDLAAKYPPPNN